MRRGALFPAAAAGLGCAQAVAWHGAQSWATFLQPPSSLCAALCLPTITGESAREPRSTARTGAEMVRSSRALQPTCRACDRADSRTKVSQRWVSFLFCWLVFFCIEITGAPHLLLQQCPCPALPSRAAMAVEYFFPSFQSSLTCRH